jgi:flagellar biosynthesis chaperone FliJ
MKNLQNLKNERETVAKIRDSKAKELEILNKYLYDIDTKIQGIKDNEIFFTKVQEALENGWSSNEQEKNHWLKLLTQARNGNEDSLILLRSEFKFNDAFKKETGAFKNV